MTFDDAIQFDSLYRGLRKSCRNVRWKDSVIGYEANALRNTYNLRQDLLTGKYKLQPYQRFTIYEPKERKISATRVRDRQVQRALCEKILYDQITRTFIRDNVACQIGKGVDDCLNRITRHMRRYRLEHGTDGWVLKCDIHHYFDTTRHDVAKAAVRKRVKDQRAADYACNVIDSFGGDVGVGLGSQISQLVQLAVLDDMDHFIKERLHIKYYVRYMDDFTLIHESKEYLQYCLTEIEKLLDKIGLQLNKKTCIYPLAQGIKMLHWRFVYSNTGAVLRLFDSKKPGRERKKLRKQAEFVKRGKMTIEYLDDCVQSWIANAKRGDTYCIQVRMKQFYGKLRNSLKEMIDSEFESTLRRAAGKGGEDGGDAAQRAGRCREERLRRCVCCQ